MKRLKRKKLERKLFSFLLTLAMIVGLMPGMGLTAYAADVPYASLKNTTSVINFDGKEWYLIDYDTSTVTLLSKEFALSTGFCYNIRVSLCPARGKESALACRCMKRKLGSFSNFWTRQRT